jgi:hypothetical protein
MLPPQQRIRKAVVTAAAAAAHMAAIGAGRWLLGGVAMM